jgi:hypothetical protein
LQSFGFDTIIVREEQMHKKSSERRGFYSSDRCKANQEVRRLPIKKLPNKCYLYKRQLLIGVSKIAEAPMFSSCSMTLMTSLRRTMQRTEHHAGSSKALTVGELKPGVICSAAASFVRGTLYSKSE